MAKGINKVIVIGNLGADPETRYVPSGSAVTNFNVAVSESWKDKQTGEQKERTEWIKVETWGKLAEICAEHLTKGRQVYVEGKLQTDKWTDKDGVDRWTTKVRADDIAFLGTRSGGGEPRQSAPRAEPPQQEFDDDIPF